MVALSPAYLATLQLAQRRRRQQQILSAWLQGAHGNAAVQALVSALATQGGPTHGWAVYVALPAGAGPARDEGGDARSRLRERPPHLDN